MKYWMLVIVFTWLVLAVSAHTAHAATGGAGLPWETPLTTLSNSVTGPVAYSVSLIGILIFAGGQVNEFLRAVLFCVLVIAFIIAAKNTLTAFGFAAGAEITQSQSLTHGVVYGAPSGHVASSWD
jgi:type IV secretion system protein VirB2